VVLVLQWVVGASDLHFETCKQLEDSERNRGLPEPAVPPFIWVPLTGTYATVKSRSNGEHRVNFSEYRVGTAITTGPRLRLDALGRGRGAASNAKRVERPSRR
jgi:hypothetical protein